MGPNSLSDGLQVVTAIYTPDKPGANLVFTGDHDPVGAVGKGQAW